MKDIEFPCQSQFASSGAKLLLREGLRGYVWLAVVETKNGERVESELIKVLRADLLEALNS